MSYRNDYWRNAASMALQEFGIEFTLEQIATIGDSLAISAEHEGEATGRDAIPNPMLAQVDEAKRRAEAERKEYETELTKAEKRRENETSALRYRINELGRQLKAGAQ